MFKNIYPENIKLTMHWSDTQYETFVKDWEAIHLTYISEFRKSYILSDKSFELLLSLFFVSVQALKIPSTLDVKSALITILIFNVIYDDRVLNQTEDSIETLKEFLNNLVQKRLISNLTANTVAAFLNNFLNKGESSFYSDLVTQNDISFVRDLLISTNPVILDNKHVMYYYDNPHETIFSVKKPYPTPVQFFDSMFFVSRSINCKFLRGLYMERVYRLMETQAKKSIFPF